MSKQKPNPIDLNIARRLRERRLVAGWSQERLGDALGLTFQQVQKYERGANRVSASMLVRTARFLECPVAYLVDEDALKTTSADTADQLMAPGAMDLLSAWRPLPPASRQAVLNLVRAIGADNG